MLFTHLNIHQAKTHLSRYVKLLAKGENFLICIRNIPVAKLTGIATSENKKSLLKLGTAKSLFEIPESFFEPLSKNELASWSGDISL